MAKRSVVVMGAGPGGLCAAYVLTKAGLSADVFDKAPVVGGLARTIRATTEHGEFRFDIGGHRWFTKNDELNELFREVIGEELLWVDRVSRIYFDGSYVDYPLKISNALAAIGPVTAAKAMLDYAATRVAQRLRPRPIVSMEDAYVDQFGHTLYARFFQRYSEKVWGLPCSAMSGDWVAQRSKGMSLLTAVKDAVLPSRGAVVSLIDRFMYPRNGFGRLSERMADAIIGGGNGVHLNAGVVGVHRDGHHIRSVTIAAPEGPRRIDGDQFVSSIPLTLLIQIMDPPAPPEVLEAARALTFRNIITVNLMLRRRQVTPDTWLYVHDRDIAFGRLHEPKNWSPAMVPGDDYTSIVAEYFCSLGDTVWQQPDDVLVARTIRHLVEDLRFIAPDEVLGGFCVRAPRAYPAYVLGYEAPLARVKDFISRFENLQIIGRYGTFRYNNTDHSIETGLLAAKNILGESHNLDHVNSEREYHEVKRVPRVAASNA